MNRQSWRYLWPVISIAAIAGVWYWLSRYWGIDPFLLPAPTAVAERLASLAESGALMNQAALTLYRTLAGFALGVVVGSLIGLLMGNHRFAEWLFEPVVSFMFPTPKISFLPIFILWFGTFDLSKILIAAFICMFPVISACHEGVKDMDKRLPWVGLNMGMSQRKVFWKIVMPGSIPALLNGAEIALPFAFISVTVAEMTAGGGGIGSQMMLAARFADSRAVMAWIVALAVLGALISLCARGLRRRLLAWHTEVD